MDVLDRVIPTLKTTGDMIAQTRKWNQGWKRISEIELRRRSIDCPNLQGTINKGVVASQRRCRAGQEQIAACKRKDAIQFNKNDNSNNAEDASGKLPPVSVGGCPPPDPEDPWGGKGSKDQEKESSQDSEEERFRKAVKFATTETKLTHFFENKSHDHGFNRILDKMGGRENDIQIKLVEEVIKQIIKHKKLPAEVAKGEVLVMLGGETICVRIFMGEGIVKIATMFVI